MPSKLCGQACKGGIEQDLEGLLQIQRGKIERVRTPAALQKRLARKCLEEMQFAGVDIGAARGRVDGFGPRPGEHDFADQIGGFFGSCEDVFKGLLVQSFYQGSQTARSFIA